MENPIFVKTLIAQASIEQAIDALKRFLERGDERSFRDARTAVAEALNSLQKAKELIEKEMEVDK